MTRPGRDETGLHPVPPGEARSLDDIRAGIDGIDRRIIELLALRLAYVHRAADFKSDLGSVPAPERVRAMLDDRAEWAGFVGLSPDFIAPLFAQISEWFIRQQIAHWPDRNPVASESKPDPTPAPGADNRRDAP
ncbi:chorismate mutase [Paracoccus methylarcula]|uniref:chorismate mutase n=1 Tax=Paracoccus methylarcula TaxID=72022 RepID=A0A3R7NE37_9RHOB|nr:chorismate mutase [Paracoccus methylarcula]RNF35943.1 isochorismate-pyruvate lyase [Paracoccus methylarcula]